MTQSLIIVESYYTAIDVAQAALRGVTAARLRSTPPVAEASKTVEGTNKVAEATRMTCKTALIGSSGVRANPMCRAGFLHFPAGDVQTT